MLLPLRLLEIASVGLHPSRLSQIYHRLLVRALGARIEVVGAPFAPNALIVANHISWTDIIMLGAATPATFVAKAEVRGWPFLGALARLNPTLFVERDRPRAIKSQIETLRMRLAHGRVVLFPEGTTGGGSVVLPFRPALLDAAAGRLIQPVTILYAPIDRDRWREGELGAFAWDGDKSFWPHLLGVSSGAGVRCKLVVHHPFEVGAGGRKAAAMRSRAMIETGMKA